MAAPPAPQPGWCATRPPTHPYPPLPTLAHPPHQTTQFLHFPPLSVRPSPPAATPSRTLRRGPRLLGGLQETFRKGAEAGLTVRQQRNGCASMRRALHSVFLENAAPPRRTVSVYVRGLSARVRVRVRAQPSPSRASAASWSPTPPPSAAAATGALADPPAALPKRLLCGMCVVLCAGSFREVGVSSGNPTPPI